MSREVVFTIKGDGEAVSNFVNERLVKPALAAISAERAELMIADQMSDLRREHESALADLEDEKQEVIAELQSAREKIESHGDKVAELHEAIGKWQLCAMAYQAQLEVKSKVEKQSKELKDKLFAMMDLVGNRQKVKAIQALREITGCTLNEGKVVLDKVFENFSQEQAKVIPLPPSSLAKQMELLPEP